MRSATIILITIPLLFISACDKKEEKQTQAPATETRTVEAAASARVEVLPPNPLRNAYWGDTHLHTSYLPDAFLMGNQSADPDTAYHYAKGLPVIHPYHRARIQIGTPLDFLVVSDHGEFMGVIPNILKGNPLVANTETGKRYTQMFADGKAIEVFGELIAQINKVAPINPELGNEEVSRSVWGEIMAAADRHNEPGKFTAFMGWEWSSTPGGANLHRVVVMREGKDKGVFPSVLSNEYSDCGYAGKVNCSNEGKDEHLASRHEGIDGSICKNN